MKDKVKSSRKWSPPVQFFAEEKADFLPTRLLDSGTCISSHGISQLENQCTTSE
jgi:hypothetical protein